LGTGLRPKRVELVADFMAASLRPSLSVDMAVPLSERGIGPSGPRMTPAETKAIAPYCGCSINLTPQWVTRACVEYERLLACAKAPRPVRFKRMPNALSECRIAFSMSKNLRFRLRPWVANQRSR
jgi:hypothetical protein